MILQLYIFDNSSDFMFGFVFPFYELLDLFHLPNHIAVIEKSKHLPEIQFD